MPKRQKILLIILVVVAVAGLIVAGFGLFSSSSTISVTPPKLMWGAFLGDIIKDPSLVPAFDAEVNASSDIVAVFTDLSPGNFPMSVKTSVGAQGKTLLLFLEPQYSLDQLNSGAYDSLLQQDASASLAYGYPIILAPLDEFNLNEGAWGYSVSGNTPTKFIRAWQHIHSFFANVPNVKFVLTYNNQNIPDDGTNTYAAYYPGDAYVDYVGVDGFNFGTSTVDSEDFNQLFDPIMPTLESFKKPILLSSIGSLEFPEKAHWITYGLDSYIKQYPDIAGWVYFDYNDITLDRNWTIDTDTSSVAAFEAVLQSNF